MRMLTACLIGVVLLSGAVWSYQQLEAVSIPTREWSITVAGSDATKPLPKVGDSIELHSPAGSQEELGPKVVTGTVHTVQAAPGQSAAIVTVRAVNAVQEAATPERDQTLVAGDYRGTVSLAQAVPYFDILYLQAGVVGVILVLGTILTYWLVGVRKNSVEFLIATDGEMRKVNWSTRREVMGSTWVVIGACFLIAAFLFLVDAAFSGFFQFVGLLKQQ
ncbi:MAG: preprotein translocase subunit SecE [Phycisphaerales bacterium]|nr:preprotein translocase subunit SecE [Phycisphaerales bacterium]